MTVRDAAERSTKIAALTERYRAGEFSETVLTASLCRILPADEIRYIVDMNREQYRDSLPYKRGLGL
jgi:hypothetical protein